MIKHIIEPSLVKAGDTFLFSDLNIRVLWPEDGIMITDSNEGSLVLYMEYKGLKLLFTGDIGEISENALIENYENVLDCHILKVAHHGSRYSSSESFLKAVSPMVALISAGEGNSYGHPHIEALERLESFGSSMYVTAWDGEVIIKKHQKKLKVVVWKGNDVYNRYVAAMCGKK